MNSAEKPILDTKDGIRLFEDRFVYRDGSEYFIKDMVDASMQQKKWVKGLFLLINFKNGTSKEFYFKHTVSFKESLIIGLSAKVRSAGMEVYNATMRDVENIIGEWAININTLINAQKHQE